MGMVAGTAAIVFCLSAASAAEADKKHPKELHGYWAVQKITIDGKEDGGNQGDYLVLRADGTYRNIKRGRKPEGPWEVNAENKLVMKVKDLVILKADWKIEGDKLTLTGESEGAKLVIEYKKTALEKDPKAADEK